MHVALPKRPINKFKLDQQRVYCPNIYTDGVNSLEGGDGVLTVTRESGG